MSAEREAKNCTGNIIKKMRETLGMTQKTLVDELNKRGHNMNTSTISKIETGNRGVSDIECRAFAAIFKCSICDLFE